MSASNNPPKSSSLPPEEAAPDSRRDYGSISSASGRRRASPAGIADAREAAFETGSSTRSGTPQAPRRRPSTQRRPSTKRPLPHRGELFSVDDDPSEVEEDRTPLTPKAESFAAGPGRGHSMRRKTYASQVQPLPKVAAEEEEDEQTEERREREPGAGELTSDTAVEDADDPGQETAADEDDDGGDEDEDGDDDDDDDDDDLSDAESFTLKDRQLAINETHPFGIRIWKPALYKKNRSVEQGAEEDIHSGPAQIVSPWLWCFNCFWTLFFGWWLALASAVGALVCHIFAFVPSARAYGRVFWGLARYLIWPFGKFVRLDQDENYQDEDEGEGRSISEYERWQAGDLEYGRLMFGPSFAPLGGSSSNSNSNSGAGLVGRRRESVDDADEADSLLGRPRRNDSSDAGLTGRTKRRLFGRGEWTIGRVIYFIFFYFGIAPLMVLVSLVCWFLVYWIPMARVLGILLYHLRKRPLALSFHKDAIHARSSHGPSTIVVCTYRAVGSKYWKYTIDGTNIFLINFLAVVVFVIVDFFLFREQLGIDNSLTSPALIFTLALVSIVPLAYFIGQAVASISAQSTMGVGAAVNAFFSTVVEVYLYCVALNDGKARLVEGSIIGSLFAGILLLPGVSMCFGAIKRKTQRFNVKSASATSTMLLFAVIAAFGPTLFYKIYGSHQLICKSCSGSGDQESQDCRRCYFRQIPAINDEFYRSAVRPYSWVAAVLLFATYIIGLLFTLRTHAAIIWSTDADEKKPAAPAAAAAAAAPATGVEASPLDTRRPSATPTGAAAQSAATQNSNTSGYVPRDMIRESQLYKKILGPTLRQAGFPEGADGFAEHAGRQASKTDLPHVVPPKSGQSDGSAPPKVAVPLVPGLSQEESNNLVLQVAEMAATAATYAARDAVQHPREAAYQATHSTRRPAAKAAVAEPSPAKAAAAATAEPAAAAAAVPAEGGGHGGHDAPNWSRSKSAVILLTATLAYAIVAEILVDTVDVVLTSVDIDEKFLGITLFALVPNTTEFLNGISFAMNGNIALSMEIGSAYALQVCMLQIPALVLFSAVRGQFIPRQDAIDHTFNLIFPQWDMVTTILCVFLLSYMCGEGKSNYFKGSILVLSYLVVIMGFYYSGYTSAGNIAIMDFDPRDTLALASNMWYQQQQQQQQQYGLPVGRGREL